MAKRRNGEGTWGTKTVNGITYKFYKNPDGKYFYGKTNKEINEKRKKYEEQIQTSLSAADEDIRKQEFGEYALAWLMDQKKMDLKRNTLDGYENCINGQLIKYTKNRLSRKQVGTLTTKDFIRYYSSLADNYTRGTIKKNYAILSQCVEYGNENNHFQEHINFNKIKLPNEDIIEKKKREIQFLTDDDVDKFCKEAVRVNTKGFNFGGKIGEPTYGNNAYLLMFIIFTGLRISEAIELQWGDINLEEKYFNVTKTAVTVKDRKTNKSISTKSSTKTRSGYRSIPLSKKALDILEYEDKLNPNHKKTDYVFITQNGDKIKSRQNVNRTLKNIMSRAGCSIDECTPHELRHTFGSLLIKHGVDIKVVSELLGHKDVTITYNIYIHILNEQKASAITVLDDVFK